MDRSSTSFPLISRQTGFEENDRSLFSKSSGGASKKKSLSVSGLRIAHWARRILSVTRILSKMGSPKSILVGWVSRTPFASVTMWSETRQRHGSFERDSRHSVGHLHIVENVIQGLAAEEIAKRFKLKCRLTSYRCRSREEKRCQKWRR